MVFLSFPKKEPSNMRVTNSTLHLTTCVPHEDTSSTFLFPALLPLHGYHDKLSITTRALPAELIDMIQSFCSHNDLLVLTSVDKTAWATRFCNLSLQKLCFKMVENTKQFLACCQASQEGEVQALIPEEKTISRQQAKLALSSNLMQS
jgi:hypothetical protein